MVLFALLPLVPQTRPPAEILLGDKPLKIVAFHGMNLYIDTGGALGLRWIVERWDNDVKRLAPQPLWRDLVAKSEPTTERFSFPVIRVAIVLEDGRFVVVDRDRHLAILPKDGIDTYWWKGVSRKLTETQAKELNTTISGWQVK